MEYFLLLVVVILLVSSCVEGYRKGFLRMLVSMLSLLVVIICMVVAAPLLRGVLRDKTSLHETVKKAAGRQLEAMLEEERQNEEPGRADEDAELLWRALPDGLSGYLPKLPTGDVVEKTSERLADLCVTLISMLIAFVAAFILVRIIGSALGIFNYIPVIGELNRLAGVALGLVKGGILLWLLCLLLTMAAPTAPGKALLQTIAGNELLNRIYDFGLSIGNMLLAFSMKIL